MQVLRPAVRAVRLKKDHEFNDPRWPFLIKVKDVQDKTLVDATFKHRAGDAKDPNRFDMVVQSRTATIDFDTDKGVARVHLDARGYRSARDRCHPDRRPDPRHPDSGRQERRG